MSSVSSRVYQNGKLVGEDVGRAAIEKALAAPTKLMMIDFISPTKEDLDWVAGLLHLHPIAVNDALESHSRPKLERYDNHLFLTAYLLDLDPKTGELISDEVSIFVTKQAMVTVRRQNNNFISQVEERADKHIGIAKWGMYGLFWAALDVVIDSQFDTVQAIDDRLDALEDVVFEETEDSQSVQRDIFAVRKELVKLRRAALPMREIVNAILRDEQSNIPDDLRPYFMDAYDHTLRVNEWVDSQRDLVTSLLDAKLTIQGNRMNLIMKKVTSWAAIIAVPTLITGFFGQNVAFFGFGDTSGLWISIALLVVTPVLLYLTFKRQDWL